MFELSTSDARPDSEEENVEELAEPESANPEHIRTDFYRLALDWTYLKCHLPTPPKRDIIRRTTSREYGHPASWASDTAARIAGMFHSWHDMVAEHRNETPPPPENTAETVRITAAWKYLEPRIEQLCELVTRDDLAEIGDLHRDIRRTLGLDRQPAVWLGIECPVCDLRTVLRDLQRERISCGSCGWSDTDEHKEFHVFRTLVNVVERHEPFLP